ncbi:CAZyme family GH20 [Paecilomyces variotii]|nr:CAZyme family GH20 [Paecilomyces variotii]KAJ9290114.1 CAZyme family GH20 [Paecilomyces variotii]KAJ9329888.1 CAZyme family GH20 [Paecilomyces variotii]KAJ9337335.1 CAZyme family GH20 [Paecilomyces variotii]
MYYYQGLLSACIALSLGLCSYARLLTVPTTPFTPTEGTYSLHQLKSITISSQYANTVDNAGQTLIPPTLSEFGEVFRADLELSLGFKLSLLHGNKPETNSIFLTIDNETTFHDIAGRATSEGYTLTVDENGIIISGASPLGTWWGTRSLIQAAVLHDFDIPHGSGTDAPGWATRGVMLDAGRHYYPPDFLIEMCSYLSFFKQNVFHVHLSDNLYNNVDEYSREESLQLYAAFRLLSADPAVEGLNKRINESYTRSQFDNIQEQCAKRGVTIIPEIESPGHALVIVQWKPDIGLEDLSMINITQPDSIPTVQTIWKTFLPWFHSKVVHIGADEYDSSLVADYTRFVNSMHEFIKEESSKDTRIWGTFTPSEGSNVSHDVSIQHWEFFEDNPYFDYIKNGYDVLNSDDAFYVVGKWSGSYPQILNKTRVFYGDPAGGPYAPNIFDTKNATNNPPRNNPHVLGQVAALWNDYGPNATTVLEAYYSLRDVLPALADKQWGGDLLEQEYDQVFDKLHAAIPGQNLDRRIKSKSDLILNYNFKTPSAKIQDFSGNNYNGVSHGCAVEDSAIRFSGTCYLETPLSSKGRNYTLSFSVKPLSNNPGTLFSGPDSTLMNGNGSITNVTLISGGNPYSLNYSLPLNTWTDVRLIGRGNQTFLNVSPSGKNESETRTMEFLARLGVNGESLVWAPIAIEAPLARIGEGFEGLMKDITLRGSA